MKTQTNNIFEDIPDIIPEELFECLLKRKNLKIERIVSFGQVTPVGEWYDQTWDEWVIVLEGEAILCYEDGCELNLKAGDYLHIPAHRRHRIEWTPPESKTIWLAVHFEP
ncbi:MAG: cupin domain-containing protein [Methylococcaceae bacterium]|nr:cupin domain-containing protein [Methylococcaceae bacterium]